MKTKLTLLAALCGFTHAQTADTIYQNGSAEPGDDGYGYGSGRSRRYYDSDDDDEDSDGDDDTGSDYTMGEVFNDSLSIVITAVLFALVHFQALQLPGLILFGLVAGYLANRYGRLGPAIFAHVGFNGAAVALNPTTVAPAGGNQPHPNLQPYTAINFCIALQGIFPSRN